MFFLLTIQLQITDRSCQKRLVIQKIFLNFYLFQEIDWKWFFSHSFKDLLKTKFGSLAKSQTKTNQFKLKVQKCPQSLDVWKNYEKTLFDEKIYHESFWLFFLIFSKQNFHKIFYHKKKIISSAQMLTFLFE